jgi:hypothetical protein
LLIKMDIVATNKKGRTTQAGYDYGVQYDIDWATTYNLFSMPALALMAVAFLGLIIPAVRALGIIEIEVIDEDE